MTLPITNAKASVTVDDFEDCTILDKPLKTKKDFLAHLDGLRELFFSELPVGDNLEYINEYFVTLQEQIENGKFDIVSSEQQCNSENKPKSLDIPDTKLVKRTKRKTNSKPAVTTTIQRVPNGDPRGDPFR